MKHVIIALSLAFTASAFGAEPEMETCEYGEFKVQAATKSGARAKVTELCFDKKVQTFEKLNQRMPTTDEADHFLTNECLNICS